METLEIEFPKGSDLCSEHWTSLGFQGKDPSTDFRSGGYMALSNLKYFVHTNGNAFRMMVLAFLSIAHTELTLV